MDAVEIIILAAAGVGLVAFVVLAILILRQGRAVRELEERIGPPVPPAAAPSLERVRAVSAASAPAAVAAADAPAAAAGAPASGTAAPGGSTAAAVEPAADAPRQTARQSAEAKAAAKAEKKARAQQDREARGAARAPGNGGGGRGLVRGAVAVVIIALVAAGGWYLFIRDDGGGSRASQSSTTATATTADTGEIPEDVPPLANKAAYTVAVLNASDITGAAANKVAPRVQADGYTLGVVDNAAKQGLTESQVQYVKGRQEVGWNLAKDLGVRRAVQVDSLAEGRIGTADAVIIVGKDLAK